MESIIEGYSYDIFISYRQKDNKYDGWVTEFVDNLKKELESTFKEEVSVYFDINPHDGLLETHDVDASLKEKLKCLIFIPIISRTYCDPKSFAWEHEFKAFIEQASKDKYGLKVKVPGGNVANRLLPVRINDLDISDIKLCESILGSVLRGVDFIYKSAGVNRPLRSKEDNPHDNLNHTIYRDQINKVSLAVKDIIESMKVSFTPDQRKDKKIQIKESEEKEEIKIDELAREEIIKSKQEVQTDKIKSEVERRFPLLKKPKILIPGILITIAILVTLIFLLNRHSKVIWARERAIPEINQLVEEGNFSAAFDIANEAEKYIPNDSILKVLWPRFSNHVTTLSNPPGARVYRRDYYAKDSTWTYLGETPLDSARIPFSFSRIKVEKDNYQTVYDATNSAQLSYRDYLLDSVGTIPKNIVHIPSITISINLPYRTNLESAEIKDFLIDKYEVTNKEYKIFVDSGGYQKKQYWNHPFVKNGRIITLEEVMSIFVDKTGRPGPSTWEGGNYPEGESNYPVSGVSWYEATAYAEFIGKSLPTYYHWRRAAGFDNRLYLPRILGAVDWNWGNSFIITQSNLSTKGLSSVGTYQGMTGYGTCDMVGNVREWCWNEATPSGQHYILGGGWDDPLYSSISAYIQPPFDRSQTNGFRCAYYLHADENLDILKSPIAQLAPRDFMHEQPISDQQFEIFKRMFVYDKTVLKSVIESENKDNENWIKQKISFNAAYGDERVITYLFLPKTSNPPYQIVVYFPGSTARDMLSSESLITMDNIDFIIKSGRAVIYPVYKGTYERRYTTTSDSKIVERDRVIQWYKDLARSIDYLESRLDINTKKIAYFGFSWGGAYGPLMTVLENRIKVCILYVAGLYSTKPFPEVDPFNYVHRVNIPTLMLNGKYDATFQYETSQKPLFELLGTPSENKRHFTYETGHSVPRNELITETLNWLDHYLGPVK